MIILVHGCPLVNILGNAKSKHNTLEIEVENELPGQNREFQIMEV